MTTLLTILVFAAVMAGMALGVVVSGRTLRGSCGRSGEDCACTLRERRACARRHQSA